MPDVDCETGVVAQLQDLLLPRCSSLHAGTAANTIDSAAVHKEALQMLPGEAIAGFAALELN
jgi:hypothetical protein